ncbi:MAG: 4Fe-4S binding protein [Defluviitaleaceae bacterium]|nr:4Fe-4S binding protein [Defluviitaleaceae bacterium]
MSDFPKLTASDVKKFAREVGADLVGIGSIDRWKDAPGEHTPTSIMPRAKSVIGLAFRVHRGSFRGIEEGTSYSTYTLSGSGDINRIIAPMAQRRVASFIEDHGYEATSFMYYGKDLSGTDGVAAIDSEGNAKPAPEMFINFRVAAVLCGMGEMGHSGMVLTPKFGPAQRFYFIFTEAELEADPILENLCIKCMQCVKNCPAQAISKERSHIIDIPGVATVARGQLDAVKCRIAHIGGGLSPFACDEVRAYSQNVIDGDGEKCADGSPRPTFDEIGTNVTDKVPYAANAAKFKYPSGLCGAECVRSCIAILDKTNRLELKFHNKFR